MAAENVENRTPTNLTVELPGKMTIGSPGASPNVSSPSRRPLGSHNPAAVSTSPVVASPLKNVVQPVEHQEVEVELVDEEQESEVTQLRSALQAALNQVEELQGAEEYLMHELWKAHRMLKQVHLEQQEEEEEETESATLEEYAFQLEVALQRERHVNASLHEQLICMHQDCQAEVEYSQAEAEYQAEHEYASYTNQLLHDREELLGQLAWLEDAAEKEVESLRYNLHLSHEALADAQEAAEHNMAAAQHYEAAAEHYHQQACRMQQYLMQLQGEQIEQQEEEETDGEQEEYVDMLQSHVVELRHNLQAQDAENEQLLAECGALRQHVERVHEDWRVWAAQSAEALQEETARADELNEFLELTEHHANALVREAEAAALYEEARAERAEAKALALVAQLHAQHAVDLEAHPLDNTEPVVAEHAAENEEAAEKPIKQTAEEAIDESAEDAIAQ